MKAKLLLTQYHQICGDNISFLQKTITVGIFIPTVTVWLLFKIPNSTRPEVIVNLIVVVLIAITKVLGPRVVIVARVLGRAHQHS